MVTIKKIAAHSGYSQATVSRLLNGDDTLSIADDTRKSIIHTALSMGYDRSKIKTTIEKIALLFWISDTEELQDVYFSQLRNSLEKYAILNNFELCLIKTNNNLGNIPKDINGFIGVGGFTSDEIYQLKDRLPNGVFLEMNSQPELFDTVKPDTNRFTIRAIHQFLEKGYKRIGFIGGAFHNPDTNRFELDSRERIFRNELGHLSLLDESLIFSGGAFSVDQGYKLAKELIKSKENDLPEALFIASDTMAVGALQAFNEHTINIPNKIEIISINDNEIAKFVSPPLTTFRIDVEEMAKAAIELLVDQIVYPRSITKTLLLGSELIIRKSFTPKNS